MGLGLMYFVPHRCFPIFELIELIKEAFDPSTRITRDLKGNNILCLDLISIAKAFNPPAPMFKPLLVKWDIRPSLNVRANIVAWLDRNVKGVASFLEFSSSEVPLSNFNAHLQLLLSMLAMVARHKTDRYVSSSKLTIAYQLSHPNSPTIYDWASAI